MTVTEMIERLQRFPGDMRVMLLDGQWDDENINLVYKDIDRLGFPIEGRGEEVVKISAGPTGGSDD